MTEWVLIEASEQHDVVPTSKPDHNPGPVCWCAATEVQKGLWVHNDPN